MLILNHLIGFGGGGVSGGEPIIVDAADFDGANDYTTRGAALTGNADSKLGTLSIWFKQDATGSARTLFCGATAVGGATNRFSFAGSGSDLFPIIGANASGTTILQIRSGALTGTSAFYHVMASWDLADTAKRHLYVNGVSDLIVVTYTNDTIDYTLADWAVGANASGTQKFDGGIAELWFAPGVYIDLSVSANRAKFRSSGGKPVYLGSAGELVTGDTPAAYFTLSDGETANNFATNRGAGGNFTVTGALTTYGSSPSD